MQGNTTYTYEIPDGFAYEEYIQSGKCYLKIWSSLDVDQLRFYTLKAWASNTCGVVASQKDVTILDKDATTLPVELICFKGAFSKNAVELTWSTASEKDNQSMEVERSTNALNFVKIGKVKGNGNSQITQN